MIWHHSPASRETSFLFIIITPQRIRNKAGAWLQRNKYACNYLDSLVYPCAIRAVTAPFALGILCWKCSCSRTSHRAGNNSLPLRQSMGYHQTQHAGAHGRDTNAPGPRSKQRQRRRRTEQAPIVSRVWAVNDPALKKQNRQQLSRWRRKHQHRSGNRALCCRHLLEKHCSAGMEAERYGAPRVPEWNNCVQFIKSVFDLVKLEIHKQ